LIDLKVWSEVLKALQDDKYLRFTLESSRDGDTRVWLATFMTEKGRLLGRHRGLTEREAISEAFAAYILGGKGK